MRLSATAVVALMALAAALPAGQAQAAAVCLETSASFTQSQAVRAMAKAVASVARKLVVDGQTVVTALGMPATEWSLDQPAGSTMPRLATSRPQVGMRLHARLLALPPPTR